MLEKSLLILLWFFASSQSFDIDKYFENRLKIENGQRFFVKSNNENDARDLFASFIACDAKNSKIEQLEHCQNPNDTFCHSAIETPIFELTKNCSCLVDRCPEKSGDFAKFTDRILYPGCSCKELNTTEKLWKKFENSEEWKMSTNDPELVFNEFPMEKPTKIANFIQAGSETAFFNNSVASITSQVFRQSGLRCNLNFLHHFSPQSLDSTISVRAHFMDNNESFEIWKYEPAYFMRKSIFWVEEKITIGSFSRPFRISINCESGETPTSNFLKKVENPFHFACSLANVDFSGCDDIGDPSDTCSHASEKLCEKPGHAVCAYDSICDLNMDCSDGSDEENCYETAVPGTMCDFNNDKEFCPGWKQYTNATEDRKTLVFDDSSDILDTESLAKAKALNSNAMYLFENRIPSQKYGLKSERTAGSGGVLSYEAQEMPKTVATSVRLSALVSPVFEPTNPQAYNSSSPFFQSCKLRFWINARFQNFKWQIAVISRAHDPFLSGRRVLLDSTMFSWGYQPGEWSRQSLLIPRQNHPYRIGIFVDHYSASKGFFAIDDLTISQTCFAPPDQGTHIQKSQAVTKVTTCGATGSTPPLNCDRVRDLDGQNSLYLKKDGTQDWTVDQTGFYRVEGCGGAGGGLYGIPGQCATFQVHLHQDLVLQMLVGQHGEMACRKSRYEAFSCRVFNGVGKKPPKNGGGGGGATLITVRDSDHWKIILGGGAGQGRKPSEIEDIGAGYGATMEELKIDPRCGARCNATTPEKFFSFSMQRKCPDPKDLTVLGGFGGGASSCSSIGGGGAGMKGGDPLGDSEEEKSGTNYIDEKFSRDFRIYQNEILENGKITFKLCTKSCESPSVCRFGGENLEKEFCACPDGSEYMNSTDSCQCSLYCPYSGTCQFRNFTMEQFCMCPNGMDQTGTSFMACGDISLPWLFAVLLFISVVIVSLIAFLFVKYFKRRNEKVARELIEFSLMRTQEYLYDDIYFGKQTRQNALEKLPAIDREVLLIGKVLGKGNFGEVLLGKYHETDVAVKTISKPFSASISAQADFCNEALCMGTFIHENIVRLIGVDFENVPYVIASEYMEGGDLLTFVKEARPSMYNLNPYKMTMCDLVKIVSDVAAGCECLEDYGYVHRDIAARNILLTNKQNGRVAKIADFGMAKEMSLGSEYYRVHGRAMLPIKWTPPEAFIDGLFTAKSDVWSFGILCWEVFSLGVVPYPSRKNEEVMLMLTEGGRLEYPFGIPMRIYQLMRDCWKTIPADRPSFTQINETIEDISTDPSVSQMAFPIHPAVRASFAHSQSNLPNSCDTPQTAVTEISMNSIFMDRGDALKISPTQQDLNDMIKLHELMLIQEKPYNSEMADSFVDGLRKELAKTSAQNTMFHFNTQIAQLFSPNSLEDEENAQMINNSNVVSDQTPPSSIIDFNKLAVQNTGPTLHRPNSLNFQDCEPLLAENPENLENLAENPYSC